MGDGPFTFMGWMIGILGNASSLEESHIFRAKSIYLGQFLKS